ncbi:MAG: hypothetical protein ACP5LI_05955 [Hydrogenobaculum sp.]
MANIVGFLSVFLIFLIMLIGLFISHFTISILPSNTIASNTANSVYSFISGFFDSMAIILLVVFLFIDVISAYMQPSKVNGVANLLLLFALAYIVLFLQGVMPTLNSVLAANTILPNTYAVLSSSYMPFLVMAFAFLATILNFRNNENEAQE